MPRWRDYAFRLGLSNLAVNWLMAVYAFLHTAALDSDAQQGLDLVKWAHRILVSSLISFLFCTFGKRSRKVLALTLSLPLVCLSYLVAFDF